MPDCTYASSPFDHPKADIILRSSDRVDFRVFKLFLALASPLFETMFELPQPTAVGTSDDTKDGLPVIPMQENSKILDTFLRFCYPSTLAEDPSLDNLIDIKAIIGVAKKYSLELIERRVCQALASPKVLEAEPLRCFAIARNARLKDETIIAARYTLRQPLIPTWLPEIDMITASDLLALLTYHNKCSVAAASLLANLDWMTNYYSNPSGCDWLLDTRQTDYRGKLPDPPCRCARSGEAKFQLWKSAPFSWWTTYMEETFELLRDTPSGDIVRSEAEKTIQKVRKVGCTNCSAHVKEKMEEFSNLLALNVDKATASIELEIDRDFRLPPIKGPGNYKPTTPPSFFGQE
ncbi:uncharacterized protein F5147DRAFT_746759 [Suillus discolor]|uniref:BTB domain-containing protein n=1 Tax=Suillus discolor TaxID=1912936 RepID=A0A9P7F3B6_9AGAM|nr:uncharacterized protein F5147DRAFT_746759 [Suillus discolor]KAG2103118.1 hypothetical protein F5147DRAFT_746759 [Suillus discolor]